MGCFTGIFKVIRHGLGHGFIAVKLYHAESVLTSQGRSGQVDDALSHEGAV